MDVTLPDGTTIKDVPDGTTKAQLAIKLKAKGHAVPDDWLKGSAPAKEAASKAEETGFMPTLARAGKRTSDIAQAPLSAAMSGLGLTGKKTDFWSMLHSVNELPYEAGGAASELATKAGARPEVAGGIGYATNVGLQALPMFLGGNAAKAASPAIEAVAKGKMQEAMKPTLEALRTGKAASAIQTMLDEGINVTRGGMEKLREKIGVLDDQITKAIETSPETVDKGKVSATLHDALEKFEKQATPQADMKAITDAWENFSNHPLLVGKQDIPVKLAQEMKQGTYQALGSKSYGELKGADREAQKALARGLKEQIAEKVPEVRKLNAEESKLLNALDVTERRVLMSANNNTVGLGSLAQHPAQLAVWMADRSPLFKSLIARMIYSGKEQIPATAARLGIAGVEAAGNQPEYQPRTQFGQMLKSTGGQ